VQAPCIPVRDERLTKTPLVSIVDDEDEARTATERLVRSLGFTTRTFASAEAFIESSALSETQCLILDVQMPKTNGLELQYQLLRLGIDIPIIFITAYPDETVRARALEAGAIAFLSKPSDLGGRRLVECLHAAINRKSGQNSSD
jgi:FixJ family two-component response regulator